MKGQKKSEGRNYYDSVGGIKEQVLRAYIYV